MADEAVDFILTNGVIDAVKLSAQLVSLGSAMDVLFILVSGYLVFMMQAGFAMLTAGSIRSKNTKNVLLKNVLDACVGSIAYFLFGWAFAYGPGSNKFIGYGNWALSAYEGKDFTAYHNFFFQWAFAATAATIVSGSVAERASFYAYLAYAFFLTAFVYPVVSHWVWSGTGFLANDGGFIGATSMVDFAGCSVVHMVGGFAGLAGAIVVGPRLGRFDAKGTVVPIPGHSATLCTIGTFMLWFGWYGFNPGSTLTIQGENSAVAARCAVATTLAAGSGGIATLVIVKFRDHIFDLLATLNGILAGLVSVSACCAYVDGWAAITIGAIGAFVYVSTAMLLIALRIDDPLEAFPIHGACGFWGVIAGGLFNRKVSWGKADYGLLYGGGGNLLLANVLGAIIIAVWTLLMITPVFIAMRGLGLLRISAEEEIIGNDLSKHGGAAYPEEFDNLAMNDSLKGPKVLTEWDV